MITLHAIVHCEQCPAQLLVEDSPMHARNAALVAKGEGWRTNPEICPACVTAIFPPATKKTEQLELA